MGILDGHPGKPPRVAGFDELTAEECWELLAAQAVGRIGYTGTHGPQILPVNHAVDGDTIVFRTAAYNSLARDVSGNRVAFEVDDLNEPSCTGSSVLAVGPAEMVNDPDDLVRLWTRDGAAEPWAPGTRTLYIRISPQTVTGRRIRPTTGGRSLAHSSNQTRS